MRLIHTPARKTAFGALGVLAALGIGGTAYAATSSSPAAPPAGGSSTAAIQPAARAAHPYIRSLLRRADHASIELKVKGQWVTYDVDRGTVTAVSPTSITLARPDGQSVTEAISPATRFRGVSSESGIQLHRPALVVSQGGTAVRIRQAAPDPGTSFGS